MMWKASLLMSHLLVMGLFSGTHASCDLQAITGDDAENCSDDLHIEYPNIGDMSCKRVTLCQNVTKDLKVAPVVTYPKAQEDKKYLLMMVDPDAPSRNNPIRRYWRHWLVLDIQASKRPVKNERSDLIGCYGQLYRSSSTQDFLNLPLEVHGYEQVNGLDILSGQIKGKEITGYNGPAPPANSGYHRYQFLLYVQPPDSSPALLASEEEARANFDPDAFALRFILGKPVAKTQFIARNFQQKDL